MHERVKMCLLFFIVEGGREGRRKRNVPSPCYTILLVSAAPSKQRAKVALAEEGEKDRENSPPTTSTCNPPDLFCARSAHRCAAPARLAQMAQVTTSIHTNEGESL